MLDLYFLQSQYQTTVKTDTIIDSKVLEIDNVAGFVDQSYIGIFTGMGSFFFATQLGAPSGNQITLDTPIDKVYPVGATVISAIKNLNVNGAGVGNEKIFQIGPIGVGAGIEIDITRINGYIQSATAMDDGTFGDIAALTNGIVLRSNNGSIQNIWNAKTNGDLALICATDLYYTAKPPAGTSYGLRFRNSFAGQEKHGVTVRLETGDVLELVIQDNLSTLQVFNLMAQGHIVTN